LTYRIEQNNGRQRHWFARFKRKSIVVTRSLLMLELTMRLFATFHVNGSDAPLLKIISPMIG
jgi:insertion element IS1 protein InsB